METVKKELLPGYRVNAYRLVITPHRELWERIMKAKEEFAGKYQGDHSLLGRPYLTIANFSQYAMMEERVLNRIRQVAMAHYPFKVELKDFGNFPSHTIYVNVLSRLPVLGLVKSLRSQAQRIMKLNDEHKPFFVSAPHLTLAARLKPETFAKAWPEYSHRHFSGRFIASSVSVLRKTEGEQTFRAIADFAFQNLPVEVKQGELFG